jgi:hypothetical protein
MGGGLIQLLAVGIQDIYLIGNPQITFFKTVFKKHTNFSLEQIIKNIGTKKFDCFHQFKIDKVTDLLSGLGMNAFARSLCSNWVFPDIFIFKYPLLFIPGFRICPDSLFIITPSLQML